MARLAVIGGGMGGMATALFAARRGHDVVVADNDPGPTSGDVSGMAAWPRRGVAQAGFSHYFLARSTRVVREEAPDLLDALDAVGIGPSDVRFGAGFEDDRALTARRTVYEGVLRQAVEREPGVTFVHDRVRGLLADPGAVPRVRGVRLEQQGAVPADLVVDAGGRRSAATRWLREHGSAGPAVEEEPCGRHYYCHHYQLRDGGTPPSREVPIVALLPYAGVLVFLGDNGTFSVAVELSDADPYRERLQDPEVFDRFLRAIPLSAEWLDRADPVGELRVMAGLSNRRRRLVVDGQPVATGMALVGDACQYTNPALGQGVSLSFWMAQRLAASIERLVEDPAGGLVAHEAWVEEELGPRFQRQLRNDRENSRQLAAGLRGEGFIVPAEEDSRIFLAVWLLGMGDDAVRALTQRVGHLLEPPSAYGELPGLLERARTMVDDGLPLPPGEGALPRHAFEALVTA